MNFLKVLYCRVFQAAFRAALPLLPYREPTVLTSCEALGDVLEKKSLRTVLLVTDSGIVKNGLTAPLCTMLETHGIAYAVYDRTQPNPTVQNVEEAVAWLNSKGIETEPIRWDPFTGKQMVFFRDPDDLPIELHG